jgi:hypothetical protein
VDVDQINAIEDAECPLLLAVKEFASDRFDAELGSE